MEAQKAAQDEIGLVRKAAEGDSSAFGALYDKYQPAIYRFIFLKVSHREEAEDITHQAFLSAWEHLPSFRYEHASFSSWIYRIARNKVIDHYRTRKISTPIESIPDELAAVEMNAAGDVDAKHDMIRAYRALAQLSDDQRDVIIMRFINELPYATIAHALGKNQATIRVIQYRALAKLKKIMQLM